MIQGNADLVFLDGISTGNPHQQEDAGWGKYERPNQVLRRELAARDKYKTHTSSSPFRLNRAESMNKKRGQLRRTIMQLHTFVMEDLSKDNSDVSAIGYEQHTIERQAMTW